MRQNKLGKIIFCALRLASTYSQKMRTRKWSFGFNPREMLHIISSRSTGTCDRDQDDGRLSNVTVTVTDWDKNVSTEGESDEGDNADAIDSSDKDIEISDGPKRRNTQSENHLQVPSRLLPVTRLKVEVESPRSPMRFPMISPKRSPTRSPARSPTRSPMRSPTRSPTMSPKTSSTDVQLLDAGALLQAFCERDKLYFDRQVFFLIDVQSCHSPC